MCVPNGDGGDLHLLTSSLVDLQQFQLKFLTAQVTCCQQTSTFVSGSHSLEELMDGLKKGKQAIVKVLSLLKYLNDFLSKYRLILTCVQLLLSYI